MLYKTSKIDFFTIDFHDLLHGDTGGYKRSQGVTEGDKGLQRTCFLPEILLNYEGLQGLQGITGRYKGLHGVTKSYKGLQGVTEGYKGLQGVTKSYRGLTEDKGRLAFLTSTSPDTFSSSILHKNQG